MAQPTVLDVLDLEEIDRDLFRSRLVFPDPYPLYGGQVAAQALLAAGRTVEPDRLPHSLHGYFLRSGDAARPTVFRVDRDRDGRSFSARRVVALQGGEVIFNMSASFQAPGRGPDVQVAQIPDDAGAPEDGPELEIPRLFSMDGRRPPQRFPTSRFPTRFWARTAVPLPDDELLHASVLTYLSDIGTGLGAITPEQAAAGGDAGADGGDDEAPAHPGASLDHALWFHRPVDMGSWVLMDMAPHTVSLGRGWYTGSVFTTGGVLAASFAQETLYRPGSNPYVGRRPR